MQQSVKKEGFFGYEFGSIATGVVRGYIVAQRDKGLRGLIPKQYLDFAFYIMTGEFDKADKIAIREIQELNGKAGGFVQIMNFCLMQQIKYKNR
jgi:hypothetical protein